MPNFDTIINFLVTIISSPFVAGLAGGYVRAILLQERNKINATLSMLLGGLCAHYIMPGLLKYADLTDMTPGEIGTLGFFVGMIGIYVAMSIIRLAIRYANNPSIPTKSNIVEIVETISKPKDNEKG